MRAISLIEPYATLIVSHGKRVGDTRIKGKQVETRSWYTGYRGPIAIHASAGKPKWAREACENSYIKEVLGLLGYTFDTLPRGGIRGLANLYDVVKFLVPGGVPTHPRELDPWAKFSPQELAFGDFTEDRFGFGLKEIRELPEIVPCAGALSIWEVPQDVEDRITALLAPPQPVQV